MAADKKPKLTTKQKQFVLEYLKDFNATQAAIRAGYSKKTADVNGPRLMGNDRIKAAVQEKIEARRKKIEITQENLIAQWGKIAYCDPLNYVDIEEQTVESVEEVLEDGTKVIHVHHRQALRLKPLPLIDGTLISEISETKDGRIKIKWKDSQNALENLAKHLGILNPPTKHIKHKIVGAGGGPILFKDVTTLSEVELKDYLAQLEADDGLDEDDEDEQ